MSLYKFKKASLIESKRKTKEGKNTVHSSIAQQSHHILNDQMKDRTKVWKGEIKL